MNLLIIILLIILLILVLYSNIEARLKVLKQGKKEYILIEIKTFYNLLIYTKQIPFIDLIGAYRDIAAMEIISKESINNKKLYTSHKKSIINLYEMKKIFDKYKNLYFKYKDPVNYISKNTSISSLLCHTEIGVEDAGQTALITGIMWSVKSSLIALLSKNYGLNKLSIDVVPNYKHKIFKTNIDCIFKMKLGHIIVIRAKILISQIKDGGKYEWSSHRIPNEDYNGEY